MRIIANKRIISLVLTLALCLQLLPATLVNATEMDEPPETATAEITSETVPETTAETVSETTTETTPETTEETTAETTEETMAETVAESVEELEAVDDGLTPWDIILALGGPKTPYVFGPDITYVDTAVSFFDENANGAVGNAIPSMELLKELLSSYHASLSEPISWSEDGSTLTSMPVDAGEQLILLSVTDPQVYQNTQFKAGSVTGAISLAGTAGDGDLTFPFQGLGSAEYPFRGSFASSSFTVKRTLFNALDYRQASFPDNTLTIAWGDTNNPGVITGNIVASKLTSAVGKTLVVNINNSSREIYPDAAFGEISGDLGLTISFSDNVAFENKNSSSNAGLVANTVSDGTLSLAIFSFPNSITIGIDGSDDKSNNAGLLVGRLNNASLTLNSVMTPPTAVIQAPKGGAGGIVGRVDNTSDVSRITLGGNVDLSNVTVLGKYSGGVAGYAQNAAFDFLGENKVTLPASLGLKANNIVGTGEVSSSYTGGIFGWYSRSAEGAYASYDGTGFTYPSDGITLGVDTSEGEAGALFGRLGLENDYGFTAAGIAGQHISMNAKVNVSGGTVKAGALVGKLKGAGPANELHVAYTDASVDVVSQNNPQYLGGLVGNVETSSVSENTVSITAKPSVTDSFGGLVGNLGENCVLKTEGTATVSTTANITKGGGLVGQANSGSVVCLSGVTDLSAVAYEAGASVGQLVGKQDSALIFATGSGNGGNWIYKRSTNQARVDDIGNYGQVIRLGDKLSADLISIGGNNNVIFKDHGIYGTIGSADDFALHAIAFATDNKFDLYPDETGLRKKNVTLIATIDLTGTGIQGLTRDNGSDVFAGNENGIDGVTFDGGGCTLTINTGEIYGLRGDTPATGIGSGQCYRHGYYGLMGKVNSAVVKDLTIKSTMNIGADASSYAGFVFGWVDGGWLEAGRVNTLENVTVTEDSAINVDGTTSAHIGGFIGYAGGDKTGIAVKGSVMNAAISYTGTSDSVILGGALGKDNYGTSVDLSFENVTVGGSITSGTTGNAHVGGLVGDITASNDGNRNKNGASMTLINVKVTSQISNNAKTTSGGLLGYYWDNVDVTFKGTGENPYAVTTNGAKLTTNGAAAGGLCFAATGRWNMQGKAVDMGNATISNGSGALGLLVCHGERQGVTPGAYSDQNNAKALYLVMDTAWAKAYLNVSVTVSDTPAVFDEIVAYTARSSNGNYDITLNDAGIISLHTSGEKVNMTTGTRNTYENRTTYGTANQTNPNSRYYYNLDGLGTPEGNVDTPEELLLWSVWKYCASNIREYLPDIASNTITGTLDMDGYSYYPVDIANTDVTVQGATITFHNAEIEAWETENKSTLASAPENRTQHFTMHSGLLNNYYTDSSATTSATLKVTNLTLLGTVGMAGSSSGALICGKIYGYDGTHPVKLELNTLKVDDGEEHLSVANFTADNAYAPLLISRVGSFATLDIVGVTAEEAEPGATSLIGKVGDDADPQGINLSLSQMKLPDEKGRFTKATMLHSLYYKNTNNSAVYNFTKAEDWNGTDHIYKVTYGKEIGGTVEYADSASNPHQYCYAQSTENVSHTGNHFTGEPESFAGFLPYVYQPYTSGEDGYHELKVNSSLQDIDRGCGTYGDPYQISTAAELQSMAAYLATGRATQGWKLNIAVPETGENTPFCSGSVHAVYVYDGSQWIAEANSAITLTNDTVLAYLRNAYYQITGSFEVNNFTGFGTRANPFRGVVVGAIGNETITLNGTLPKGFIVCSYGSVVKNLNLVVNGTTTVPFTEIQNNSGYTADSYYGGVIGCILGGDNIIDGVDVTYSDSITHVSLGTNKSYLIPVGGYVGVISGGGVIFRGDNTLSGVPSSYVEDDHYFYANPYVGRVIQGFAVQEGNGSRLNNSDKNYQICQLKSDDNNSISISDGTITLKDAQALLVFSSVTNSGGAGSGTLLPYYSNARTYWHDGAFSANSVGGKVRNASYSNVGSALSDDADYQKSLADDYAAVSATNTSYLDTRYANGDLYSVCGNTAYTINLASGIYDMTTYGNGYRSISPRYLANAVCSSATNSVVGSNYQFLNPLLSGFNGNSARIQTNITVKEYVDDDHHAIAVGGVFNTLRFNTGATLQDVTIGGAEGENKEGTISHEYYEWTNGTCADATHKNWNGGAGFTNLSYEQGRGLIAIGGFAGNNVMSSETKGVTKKVTFQNVNTSSLYIKGPFDAGGIIGHTGLRVTSSQAVTEKDSGVNYRICYLTDGGTDYYVVPTFQNCRYSDLTIHGGTMVGGYIGIAAYNLYAPTNGGRNAKVVSIAFNTSSDGKLGANSSIICKRPKTDAGIDDAKQIGSTSNLTCLPAAGGLLGCSSFALEIKNEVRATIENVEVRSSRSAGGVIAWPLSTTTIENLSIIGNPEKPNRIGDLQDEDDNKVSSDKTEPATICEFAGGLIGYFEGSGYALTVTDCTVENLWITASRRGKGASSSAYPCYAGGIVGNLYSNTSHVIANCKVKNVTLANVQYSDSSQTFYGGGLVGRFQVTANGILYGANILTDNIQFSHSGYKVGDGNLLGQADSSTTVYLAGVSIQNTSTDTVLEKDIGGTKPTKCYIAYADYTGAAQDDPKAGSVVSDSAEPHVTTSPKGVGIPIGPAGEDGSKPTMYLYGDGADPGTVRTISTQASNTDKKKFYYSAAKAYTVDAKYSSTFYAEMGLTEKTANGIPNFPVLQVPVSDKTTVTNQIKAYLNLITNNGYSTALDTNVGAGTHVSASRDLYCWNSAGYFEKIDEEAEKAFQIGRDTEGYTFATSFTTYDNGKNQFELLTVTFTEKEYSYKVQVPIVVRRMLEVDFTATLKDSPSFKESDYEVYKSDGFKPNITVGYGTSVSALLTFTYNRAIGAEQDYNWQFHLDNGGFMGDPGQTLVFYNPTSKLKSLPKGTQLILLDCTNNNKAYHYQVGEQPDSVGTSVGLSEFLDSDRNPHSRWLSEIMGLTAAKDLDGKWVLLDDETGATARVWTGNGYQFFRPKTDTDTDTEKLYSLTAGATNQPTEQYYLVIYIPESSVAGIPETSETEGKNLNGYISATLPGLDGQIACNINAVRVRQDGGIASDNHSTTESTYNFLSGYVQTLSDQSQDRDQKLETDPEAYILLDQPEPDGNYLLHMDLVDEITVVKGQKDTVDTPLYFKADISLPNYAKGETDTVSLVTANGFPTGCYGTVEFYVYLQDDSQNRTYYKWDGSEWVRANNEEKALSYNWEADGGNMELYLGTANTPNVSLATIRQLAKTGNEKFYVETKMDIHMSVPAAEQVIAGAITKGNAYTKLSYTTYLASSEDGFASTNYVESKQGEVRYYQSRSGSSTITHSANDPTQLGINCSDLASANGVIYTTGVYDLTTVSNAENLIRDADKVVYTLTLWQRQENGEYAQVTTDSLDKYIRSVRMVDQPVDASGSQWQWTDTKVTKFGTTDPENSKRFLLPIRVQVNTDVETNGVTFANYQLRLTATLYKGDEVLDQPVNAEQVVNGNTEYVRYDYVTYTITRILTSGYWGDPD